jgi:hypothetical protein
VVDAAAAAVVAATAAQGGTAAPERLHNLGARLLAECLGGWWKVWWSGLLHTHASLALTCAREVLRLNR